LTARHLLIVFDSVYLAALSTWIGGAIFFTFVLAPVLFKTSSPERALALVQAICPRYFLGGAIAGAVALASFVAGPLCYHEYRGVMVGVQAMVIVGVIVANLYGGNSLTPAIRTAGRESTPDFAQLDRLKRRTASLNVLVLLIGLSLLAAHAARPTPKTSGIRELTPQERGRYDAAINRVIEDAEIKYGFRPRRPSGSAPNEAKDPLIDEETVREVESFYEQKRLRDQARSGKLPHERTPP
jgi:hypothetical protein